MSWASGSSVLAALTKISLARVRNSFANNKSCSAISHSVRFQAGAHRSLRHRLPRAPTPWVPKDKPSAEFRPPAPAIGSDGVGWQGELGTRGPPTTRHVSTPNLASGFGRNGKLTVAGFAIWP